MKIRMGFVSNSSSSSFVIIGEQVRGQIGIERAIAMYPQLYFEGSYGGEGADIFLLTDEMIEAARARNWQIKNWNIVYGVLRAGDGELGLDIPQDAFGCKAYALEQDYHATDNLEDFIERYLDED